MPICYQVHLNIIRQDEGGDERPSVLPGRFTRENPATPEEIEEEVLSIWQRFVGIMEKYITGQGRRYSFGGDFRVTSVIDC